MEDYQKRVIQEKEELDERRMKLAEFTETDTFKGLPSDEQERLILQAFHMYRYSGILADRIAAFPQ